MKYDFFIVTLAIDHSLVYYVPFYQYNLVSNFTPDARMNLIVISAAVVSKFLFQTIWFVFFHLFDHGDDDAKKRHIPSYKKLFKATDQDQRSMIRKMEDKKCGNEDGWLVQWMEKN